ncbi:MAG TPA: hypothetical protein VGB17_06210 [Pyrinomonadaceae bacterium]|jgi:serine/threonine protein kinase
MNLHPGTRLERYEIQNLLGAGGVGEVYRALDTELQRLKQRVDADAGIERSVSQGLLRSTGSKDIVLIKGFK